MEINWRKLKPAGEWVLAKSDPRAKQTRGGIILTEQITGIEKVSVEAATALRIGPDVEKKTQGCLHEGDRFTFRGFLKDATIHEFEKHEDGTRVFLINVKDILMVVDQDTKVGVFA